MKQSELKNDPTMVSTLIFTKSKNTHRRYILSMAKFTEFTKMTPEQLINEATEECTKPTPQRMIWKRIRGFYADLEKKGLAPNTRRGHVNDVIGFFKHTLIDIPENTIEDKAPESLEENMYIPDKITEMRPFVQACSPRNRAIVLCQTSSGMGSSEVTSLRVRHYREGYDPKTNTCTLKITRIKTGFKYTTFLNPEACDAVEKYLKLRDNPPKYHGKRLEKYLAKHRIYSDDDYLFIKDDLKDVVADTVEKTGRANEELRRMQPRDIDIMYRTVYAKAGFKKTKQRIDIRSHNVRKFFSNTLTQNKMPKEYVEIMMGHKPTRLDAAYHLPDIDDMKKSYLHYMQYISITEDIEYKSIETEEFKKVMSQLDDEKAKNAALEARLAQIEDKIDRFIPHEINGEVIYEPDHNFPVSDPAPDTTKALPTKIPSIAEFRKRSQETPET